MTSFSAFYRCTENRLENLKLQKSENGCNPSARQSTNHLAGGYIREHQNNLAPPPCLSDAGAIASGLCAWRRAFGATHQHVAGTPGTTNGGQQPQRTLGH